MKKDDNADQGQECKLDFTCPECGDHELYVDQTIEQVEACVDYVVCDCGQGDDDASAIRKYDEVTRLHIVQDMFDDHRVECYHHELLKKELLIHELVILCPECYLYNSHWGMHTAPEETSRKDDIYVRCTGCNAEIEFGWSEPDRGGLIWPAHSSDFNWKKCWPEPRYRDSWRKKGWLRSDSE